MTLPIKTNAAHNREQAIRLLAAGFTTADIARAFPAVFKVSAAGLLGQRYSETLADGRKETPISISSQAVSDMLRKQSSERRDD